MTQQSLLALSAIQTLAGKAIRDLRDGGKRETRNVIELCRSFAGQASFRDFWDMVKSFTFFPGSRYDPLIHRAASAVREETLKTLAVNLSTAALDAGTPDRQERGGASGGCWLQRLCYSTELEREVEEWNGRGVHTFLLELEESAYQSGELLSLASRRPQNVFVLLMREGKPDVSWLGRASRLDNLCFLLDPELLPGAGDTLLRAGALFGALRSYREVADAEEEKKEIGRWIEMGCVLGAYYLPDGAASGDSDARLYEKLVLARRSACMEILLLDLERDAGVVQDMLLGRRPFPLRSALPANNK